MTAMFTEQTKEIIFQYANQYDEVVSWRACPDWNILSQGLVRLR